MYECTFRRAVLSDVEALVGLDRDGFPSSPWNSHSFTKQLCLDCSTVVVAERGNSEVGDIISYMVYRQAVDEIEVLKLATAGSVRRQGIGTALFGHFLGLARAAGTRVIHLEVRRSNEAAIRFYEAMGFEHSGARAGYYPPDGEDALLMRRCP